MSISIDRKRDGTRIYGSMLNEMEFLTICTLIYICFVCSCISKPKWDANKCIILIQVKSQLMSLETILFQ